MSKAAVLFDLDETLIHERASTSAAIAAVAGPDAPELEAALRAVGPPLWAATPTAAYCDRIGISWWEGLAGPFGPSPDAGLAALHEVAPRYRVDVWTAALRRLGREDGAAADLAAAFAADRLRRHVCYPDAVATLERLRGRVRLGLVTNGAPDYQGLKLDGCGLRPYFDTIVISGELGFGKPDPGVFRVALERLGCAPAQAMMVGDNPARDVAGARAAGIFAVLVDRGTPDGGADVVVRDLSEVPDLVG
ncbi:MAG TPA: HAD family hydrolase [Bacillota bacterium]|nr:HAD family hydrolase [Bacillota bacterium]